MATKLKIVEEVADIVPAPQIPDFELAPTHIDERLGEMS